jgi:hypothetical protein
MALKPRQAVPALETEILGGGRWKLVEQAKAQWGLSNLTLGYGVTIDHAREWGLYVSTGRGVTSAGVEEPPLFAEPGLFIVKPDGTLYWGSVSTMPLARPHFSEILSAIDFVISKNYPARGEA